MNDRYDSPMERFFEQFGWNDDFGFRGGFPGRRGGFQGRRFDERDSSAVRMDRMDDGYRAIVDMPGFERDEIELRYRDGMLSISAYHESENDSGFQSREISERVSLPEEIDAEAISASYRNGVLEIMLPVETDHAEDYRIDVE